MRENVIETIKKEKLIAIVRGIAPEKCLKVAGALYAGGFRLVEITFDQKNPDSWATTAAAIKAVSEAYSGTMEVGAGTVTSVELVELAASAGAKYIISPDTNIDVIKRTRELGLVSMPGALTPTEIVAAHNAGADIVKLFPAGNLGVNYIKAVRAPLAYIPMTAVGGVKPENVSEFLNAGVCGFGVGGQLVPAKAVREGDYAAVEARAKAFTQAIADWEAAK